MLSEQFEEINEQLEQTKGKLIEESVGQIGAAREQEKQITADRMVTGRAWSF